MWAMQTTAAVDTLSEINETSSLATQGAPRQEGLNVDSHPHVHI